MKSRVGSISFWIACLLVKIAGGQTTLPTTRVLINTTNDDVNRKIVLPTEPGDHKLKFRTHIGNRLVELPYLLHLPPSYNEPGKKHPMLVFFHGVGECGTDLAGVYALGPMTLLKKEEGNPTFAASCPFILLCPQCPPRGQTWDTDYMYKAVDQLIAQTIAKSRADADRVYATGLSMGGLGAWCAVEQDPDLFAAVAPLSATAWHPDKAGQLLKYVSAWCVVGNDDLPKFLDGTRAMEIALSNSPMARRFSYMVGNGHDAWWPAYQNPQFYEWLLAHRRPNAAARKKMEAQLVPPSTQPLPTTPGHYLLSFQTKIADQPWKLDYSLYIPKAYKFNSANTPAMLFLHEQDTIGPDFNDICMHGPDLLLETTPALQSSFNFVVISPRLPLKCDWETPGLTPALLSLIDHVSQSINIDANRISVTGINNGAIGSWKLASEAPDRFSALVPIVTDGSLLPGDDRAAVVNLMPGRAFIKPSSSDSISRLIQLVKPAKMDWGLIKLNENASALGNVPAYANLDFLNWLEQQHRKPLHVSSAGK